MAELLASGDRSRSAQPDLAGSACANSEAARQNDAVTIASLESEKDGQSQRLADRAAEVRELADQLAQARRQFEHFQDASATQRQDSWR